MPGERMTTKTEQLNCPRDCEGEVTVTLEYEPGESNWGADSDGNRGVAVNGYWIGEAAETCTVGHVLTEAERKLMEVNAEQDKDDPEDEYDGPDSDDRDDY